MRLEPASDQASIVLVGSFNPKIFHPSWLALYKLISEEEAQDAEVRLTHPEISQFAAAYMAFEVRKDKFIVVCETHLREVIKDLVLGAFRDNLPHTPMWQLGINRAITFSCGSEERRNQFGNLLAPKAPWRDWGDRIADSVDPKGRHGGMMRLIMREQPRSDGIDGHLQADVRPDQADLSAVFVDINNHFVVAEADEAIGSAAAMDLLEDRWQAAMEGAEYVVDCLMETLEEMP